MPRTESSSEVRRLARRRKVRNRRIRRGLYALTAIIVVAVGFTAYQALRARDALNEANTRFSQMTRAVSAGDTARAQESLYAAQQATMSAGRNTSGPVWWLASKLPVVGDDVTAVRTVTDVVNDVSQGVLPPLVDASGALSPEDLQPAGGRIKLDGIEQVEPRLAEASRGLDSDLTRVRALDPDRLISQIAQPVRDLEDKLTEASAVSATADRAAKLIPPMLGADGERTYLVMFQNNAEVRATGGIPGAFALVTANNGRVALTEQMTAVELGRFDQPVLKLTSDETSLFTDKLAVFPADITFTPDFPRTAQLAQEMWRRKTGQTVDGVLSADPVALSYLLKGTGPIKVGDGQQVNADNAVQLLLNQIYLDQPDIEAQDAFFERAARSVFTAVAAGQGNPRVVLDGLFKAADEHRLLVWSDHADEKELLDPTKLSGLVPTDTTGTPEIGVYFNDGTGAKMGYYLDYDVAAEETSCSTAPRQPLRVAVTMRSNAPADAAKLPDSLLGAGYGAARGSIRTNVLVYAPAGGKISQVTQDGKRAFYAPLQYRGRPVAALTVDLAPGEQHTFVYILTSGPDQLGTPELRVTPGALSTNAATVKQLGCG